MFDTTTAMTVLGIIAAIAATVLALIFIVPEKRCTKLGKFGKFLHDVVNFKFLIVEKILQVLYILSTAICVFVGLFSLLGFRVYDGYYGMQVQWAGGGGILILLLGPIVVRLVYELLMMSLLLVKNVIQINNKLKSQTGEDTASVFSVPSVKEFIPSASDKFSTPEDPTL